MKRKEKKEKNTNFYRKKKQGENYTFISQKYFYIITIIIMGVIYSLILNI